MKLDLSSAVLDLDGKPIESQTYGKVLASSLASSGSGPAIKFYDWAVELNKTGIIEIDAADKLTLLKFAESSNISNIARGPITKAIESLK